MVSAMLFWVETLKQEKIKAAFLGSREKVDGYNLKVLAFFRPKEKVKSQLHYKF